MSPAMPHAQPLFVYGTLRDPDVLALVLARTDLPRAAPAHLAHHSAVHYPQRSYPAIIGRTGASAPGLLLYGLTPDDMAILDAFEGDEYERRPARVMVNGQGADAALYWPLAGIAPDAPDWSMQEWTRLHKAGFLEREAGALLALRAQLRI